MVLAAGEIAEGSYRQKRDLVGIADVGVSGRLHIGAAGTPRVVDEFTVIAVVEKNGAGHADAANADGDFTPGLGADDRSKLLDLLLLIDYYMK